MTRKRSARTDEKQSSSDKRSKGDGAAKGRGGDKGLASEAEVREVLEKHYPRDESPARVAYYLTDEWLENLRARARAEQGRRFAEDLVSRIESETGLDVLERLELVDRPAWLLKVLLHEDRRFREPLVTDSFLQELGGEAKLLDIWISSLGPFYYAKGYRLRPTFKEEIEGPAPPLDREDPVALRAMRVAARTLRGRGFRRVPGDVARIRVPALNAPGVLPDHEPTMFELLFEGSATPAPAVHPEDRRRRPRPSTPPRVDAEGVEEPDEVELEIEMALFQKELEDELEAIREEIDRARRPRR